MTGRGRVCIYAEHAYPILARTGTFAGGAETQVVQLARGLVERGFKVSLVTCDFGQPARLSIDGVEVLRAFTPRRGIPLLRYLHPRLTGALRALRAARAEVYYVRGSGGPAGITRLAAGSLGAGFVLQTATDYAVVRALPEHHPIDRIWQRWVLSHTDLLLAQTRYQQACYARDFGRASELVPNVVQLPETVVDPGIDGAVVWVGTFKPAKRPEWFVRLAREHPRLSFVMVGVVPPPPMTSAVFESIRASAAGVPNLDVRGFLDHARIGELFAGAALLVHTSRAEGFSNVLLEAWAHGLPTIAAVDPDGLIEAEGLGEHAEEYARLSASVGRWMADPARRRAAGARARAFAERRHAPVVVLDRLGALLDGVIARVRARRG